MSINLDSMDCVIIALTALNLFFIGINVGMEIEKYLDKKDK